MISWTSFRRGKTVGLSSCRTSDQITFNWYSTNKTKVYMCWHDHNHSCSTDFNNFTKFHVSFVSCPCEMNSYCSWMIREQFMNSSFPNVHNRFLTNSWSANETILEESLKRGFMNWLVVFMNFCLLTIHEIIIFPFHGQFMNLIFHEWFMNFL